MNIVGYSKLLSDDLARLDNTVLMAMGKEPQQGRYDSVEQFSEDNRRRLLQVGWASGGSPL